MGPHKSWNLNSFESPSPYFTPKGRWSFLRMGTIAEIDYDRYMMYVEWFDGGSDEVPITFPYIGPRGGFGAIPEKGSVGLFYYINEGDKKPCRASVLAYVPPALFQSLNFNAVKFNPDTLSPADPNEIRFKFRSMSYGDIIMGSPLGSSVFVNHNIQLIDSMLTELLVRSSDQSIIATCLNNFVFAGGVSVASGPITRNDMTLFEANKRIPLVNAREVILNDGRKNIYIVSMDRDSPFYSSDIRDDVDFYTEYRVDVKEKTDRTLNYNSTNQMVKGKSPEPSLVTLTLGTLVGADSNNFVTYGRILKPLLFSDPKDGSIDTSLISQNYGRVSVKGSFKLVHALKHGVNDRDRLGLAYSLLFQSGCFIGVDKEGHYFLNLPASSTTNTMGGGRSMSTMAQGNLKEIWGKAQPDDNSWDLTATGGIKWNVGSHNAKDYATANKSIVITTEKGITINVLNSDRSPEGYAKEENLNGKVSETITGSKITVIEGAHNIRINGVKTEDLGAFSQSVGFDKSTNVGGVSTEIVLKEKQCNFGNRNTTIAKGDDKNTLLKGSIMEVMALGGRVTLATQSILTTAGLASLMQAGTACSIKAGANVGMDAGGALTLNSAAQALLNSASFKVNAASASLNTAITKIGASPVKFPFVTRRDLCKVTGVPIGPGLVTVKG